MALHRRVSGRQGCTSASCSLDETQCDEFSVLRVPASGVAPFINRPRQPAFRQVGDVDTGLPVGDASTAQWIPTPNTRVRT